MRLLARMIWIGLLILVLLLDVDLLVSNPCYNGQSDHITRRMQLRYGDPVTLTHRDDQSVWLAGDLSGTEELRGRHAVGIQFLPVGKLLSYGVESLSPQNVTPFLVKGDNTIGLTAVDERDVAWLLVRKPCAAAKTNRDDSTVKPTPTRVLMPTQRQTQPQ